MQAEGAQRDGAGPRLHHGQHDQVQAGDHRADHGGEVRGVASPEVRGPGEERGEDHPGDQVPEGRQEDVSPTRSDDQIRWIQIN